MIKFRKKTRLGGFNNEGQTTTEYILILMVVVLIALKMRTMLSKQMGNLFKKLDTNMQEMNEDIEF